MVFIYIYTCIYGIYIYIHMYIYIHIYIIYIIYIICIIYIVYIIYMKYNSIYSIHEGKMPKLR